MKYKKCAFIFPGQGAQYPGMAKDFVEKYSVAKQTLEEADDILSRKLSKVILEGPSDTLTETQNSQVAIFVASFAILRVLEEQCPSLKASYFGGLSLGEYTALTASGRISFQKALPVVQFRGTCMSEACEKRKGSMAVVLGLDAPVVEQLVKEVHLPQDLWVANFNCPGQVVISGTLKGLEIGGEAAKAKGAKRILPLQVHGAFHSGLMQEAEDRLKEPLLALELKEMAAPLVMNVTGDFAKDNDEVRHNLISQVTRSVRWEQGIKKMGDAGVDLFVEIGCGKTLTGFNKRIGLPIPTYSIEKIEELDSFVGEVL